MSTTHGKKVTVTGAGGSIGSELCIQLLRAGVEELRLVSLTENGLYEVTKRLNKIKAVDQSIVGFLGSVTDLDFMHEAIENSDIVIHAAAHKHVPLCEDNPIEAIRNNVQGTWVTAQAAENCGVLDFVLVSSDKAVKPASIMGATKRAAELILRDLYEHSPTKFRTVRFGNVLNSSGSVIPLWREQFLAGGPITLTDKRCERYFMPIPDAVELILGALMLDRGTYVFDMGTPVNMEMLARYYIQQWHATENRGFIHMPQIKEIGLRPGEKLREELQYGGCTMPTDIPKVLFVEETVVRRVSEADARELIRAAASRLAQYATRLLWEFVR